MARKIRNNVKTQAKMASLGLKIAPRKLSYSVTDNRVLVTVGSNKMYIGAKKAGGEKEMFYAAAGIRNYMEKHNAKPIAGAKEKILNRAKNAHKSRHVWEKRYEKGKVKNPFRKPSLELVATQDEISVEVPKLIDLEVKMGKTSKVKSSKNKHTPSEAFKRSKRGLESFDKVLDKSIQKGIITTRSAASKVRRGHNNAAERISGLGINLDHRYLTFYDSMREGPKVTVRVTTKNGHQKTHVFASDFAGDETKMFIAADRLRRHILRTGRVATKTMTANYFAAIDNNTITASKPTKLTVPDNTSTWGDMTQKEQPSKSIFTKLKMWVFG